jgi:small subunit ribosomal protein S20
MHHGSVGAEQMLDRFGVLMLQVALFLPGEPIVPVVHTSTIKRARQAEKRRQRNRAMLGAVKGSMKKVLIAVNEKDGEAAKVSLREATSALSKAVTKGIIKPNTASRRISRLAVKVNGVKSPRA